jgi:hypothetical protein
MRDVQSGDSVLKATLIYPSTQAGDGIKLARLLVEEKALGDLVEVEVPRTVQLDAPVVTKERRPVHRDRLRVLSRPVDRAVTRPGPPATRPPTRTPDDSLERSTSG